MSDTELLHTELEIKVAPGASRTRIAGWLGDALKVSVSAPQEKGKANAAVIKLLAKTLGVPASSVSVVAGHTSPRKRLRIEGVDAQTLEAHLARY